MRGLMPRRLAAEMGRNGDSELAHVSPGEVVLPRRIADAPDLRAELIQAFEKAGVPIERYRVGGMDDSRNPETGLREYWGVGDGPEGGAPSGAGSGAGGDSPGDSYSGPGPGEMGASPGVSFGPSSVSGGEGDNRGGYPSRASARGGYADARNLGTASEPNVAGYLDSAALGVPFGDTPLGARGKTAGLLGSAFGAVSGLSGLGLLTSLLGMGGHSKAAQAYNEGARLSGRPHHDPETGTWTSRSFLEGLDPRGWYPGPVPASPIGYAGDSAGYPSQGTDAATDANAAPAAPGAGFYTPPYDPARNGPSWRKYLEI